MNCVLYLEILADFLLPFMAKNFNVIDGVTHQDNDPKHTSRLYTNFLENSGINCIKPQLILQI